MNHKKEGVMPKKRVQEQQHKESKEASSKTTPDVFIIESLRFSDEDEKLAEGSFLAQVLSHSREHKYFYFRTAAEIAILAKKFWESGYRYLHISCHAGKNGIETTLDRLSYGELAGLLKPYLKGRRVFFSACGAANEKCANALMKDTGCYSVMGPSGNIRFDDSAIAWASFYHRIFRIPDDDDAGQVASITRHEITEATDKMTKYFNTPFRFYYRDRGNIEVHESSAA
jgi:hypothetical protein